MFRYGKISTLPAYHCFWLIHFARVFRVNWEKELQESKIENDAFPLISNAMKNVDTTVEPVGTQRTHYLSTYTFIMLFVLFLVFQRGVLMIVVCVRASRHLHDALFRGIIGTRMYFFNSNSSGRIINRFSKDIGHIDNTLVPIFYDSVFVSARCPG